MAVRTTSKVFFYRAVNGASGERLTEDIDARALLEQVEKLDAKGRRVTASNGAELLGVTWWGPADDSTPSLLVVANIRRGGGLPAIELDGQFRKVELAKGEGIAEASHVAFLPGNVVAVIKSGYSPSHLRVAEWLNSAIKDLKPEFMLDPIIQTDVRGRLAEVDEVRALTVQYDTDQMAELQSRSSRIWRALDALRGDYGGMEATLVLRPKRGSGGADQVGAKLLEDVEGLVLDVPDEKREFLKADLAFRNSETEKADNINFVQDRLTVRVPVEQVADDESAVLSRSASRGIQEAYDRVRGILD